MQLAKSASRDNELVDTELGIGPFWVGCCCRLLSVWLINVWLFFMPPKPLVDFLWYRSSSHFELKLLTVLKFDKLELVPKRARDRFDSDLRRFSSSASLLGHFDALINSFREFLHSSISSCWLFMISRRLRPAAEFTPPMHGLEMSISPLLTWVFFSELRLTRAGLFGPLFNWLVFISVWFSWLFSTSNELTELKLVCSVNRVVKFTVEAVFEFMDWFEIGMRNFFRIRLSVWQNSACGGCCVKLGCCRVRRGRGLAVMRAPTRLSFGRSWTWSSNSSVK